MNKLFHLISLFLLFSVQMYCQPEPCLSENPDMTPTCIEACIICDIDGFTGRHESNVIGSAPADFCTFIVHNAQWIAFIAGSTDLTVNIAVSNCDQNNGLEIAIYEAIDCENFNAISNCFGAMSAVNEGESANVVVNEPLTIGQYYYLVMDGALADNCDWTLTVTNGSTQVAPLENSGTIEGAISVCPGISTDYFTTEIAGATDYLWTLDGVEIPSNGIDVNIDWTEEGTYTLGVEASNACDEANPTFINIVVEAIDNPVITTVICEDEEYILNDTISLTEAGNYEFNFLSVEGCDSTIFVNLTVFETSINEFEFDICEGDTVFIGENPFFIAGQYTEVLSNYLGCDSIISLNLGTVICLIEGETTETPVVCNGESSGQIDFFIDNGSPPFSYTYQNIEGTITGSGIVPNLNENQTISDLPAGTYLITVNDEIGNVLILIQEVTEAPVLVAEFRLSDYNGVGISCFGDADGTAEIIPVGGVSPYAFLWNTGEVASEIIGLASGDYSVTVVDNYGCEIVGTTEINEPDPLSLLATFGNASCEGAESGFINITNTQGGIAPYLYGFGADFTDLSEIGSLGSGTYTATVQDANGCEVDTTSSIVAPVIPEINLGEDLEIYLGDEIDLNVISNIELDSTNTLWSPELGLSCTNCANPIAMPLRTITYYLTVTSIDNCTTIDSLTISVIPRRRVFVPNAFSPDLDGINDILNIFGGKEVEMITEFAVYSRWGELVYQNKNFSPNDNSIGWNGEFRGEKMGIGTYVWVAQVTFLDGEFGEYKGDVLLVR